MDFYKLLQSAEEFLFEVMMWVLLFPRTLWVVLTRPSMMPAYIHHELRQKDNLRFDDMISPPLALFIAVALGGVFDSKKSDDLRFLNALGKWLEGSFTNNLLMSAVIFALPPLAITWAVMQSRGEPLQRDVYRAPFYVQAYYASPLAVLAPAFAYLMNLWPSSPVSWLFGLLLATIIGWYLVTNVRYVRATLECGWIKASLMLLGALLLALALLLVCLLAVMNPDELLKAS